MFGLGKSKGMSPMMLRWIQDFSASLAAHIFVGTGEGGKTVASGDAMERVKSELGAHLQTSLWGLGLNDEAAIMQALALLEPNKMSIMTARIMSLGDPGLGDTKQARRFREILAKLSNAEARVAVLRACAEQSGDDFKDFVEVTGSGATSQFLSWIEKIKTAAGKARRVAKEADGSASDNLDGIAARFRQMVENIRNA